MPMTPLLSISRDRTRSLREAAEQIDQANGAASVADLDDLIGEILDYPLRMRRLNNSFADRTRSGELIQPADLNAARREFLEVFDAHRDILDRYLALANQFAAEGRP